MYGKNKVEKQNLSRDHFRVNSVFYSIQGEGPDAGCPAVFIRLAGCNLRCTFCDTDFDAYYEADLDDLVQDVREYFPRLVCITGGEPLLQNILPLVDRLNDLNIAVAVETSGSVFIPGMEKHFTADRSIHGNVVVCSPKTPKLAEPLIPLIGAYKYVVRSGGSTWADGLPTHSGQAGVEDPLPVFRPPNNNVPIYIQPIDDNDPEKNRHNQDHAVLICKRFGYRLSLQIHKILGID